MIDMMSALAANLYFAVRIAPVVVIIVGAIRGIVLLSGQKREFERWTRNILLSVLSIVFLPGTLVFVGIRLLMCQLFRIDVDNIGGTTTYGEINLFLRIDRPPRVFAVVISLFLTVILSLFVSLTLLALPALLLVTDPPLVLVCWYVSVGVLFNTSVRSGDISLVVAALRKKPRSGAFEFVVVIVALIIFYVQLMGVSI
jgi:hypothetical protein